MKTNNKPKAQGRVPKLRFPEFRDAGEWEEKSLGKVAEIITGNTPSTDNSYFYGGNRLFVSPADITDKRYINSTKTTLSEAGFKETRPVKANSILFVCIGSTIGKIAQNRYECATNQQINSVSPFIGYSNNFIYSVLEYNAKKIASIAGKQAVPIINKTLFSDNRVYFPSLPEQQKIADCFSSLDELIATHSQKLDALKVYKKGLMQQLFPAEGEMMPKLRFPEFRGSEEWKLTVIGDQASKIGSGITPNGGDKNYKTEGRPFIRSQNIGWGTLILEDIAFIDDDTHSTFAATEIKEDDVFLNITGASIGRSAIADSRVKGGNVNQHVCIIRTIPTKLNPKFLNQYLLSAYGQKQIDSYQAGGNRQGLNFAQIRSFSISLPSIPEQQKIGECLCSLDDLITAQAQRIDFLKEHKKGLMQQLFPSPDEVDE
jgi:type I restriction enzyme S subunit